MRYILGVFGLICIILPAWELRRAFYSINLTMPFFAIIVGGAWTIGFSMLRGALFAPARTWRFDGNRLIIDGKNPFGKTSHSYSAADIGWTEIKTIAREDNPDAYCLILHPKLGKPLPAPEFNTRAKAEAYEAELRQRLGIISV